IVRLQRVLIMLILIKNVLFAINTKSYLSLDANGLVKCWNYSFNQCTYTIREKRQTYNITYHPRLPKFITCGDNGKMYYYDEESKVQERILSGSDNNSVLDGHSSRVFAACFNPQSNYELITGGWDDVVLFWDLRQPFALRHLSGLHMGGEGLDIDSAGKTILTCAWQAENALQLWDYGSGNLITTLEPDIFNTKLYCGRFIGKDYLICGGCQSNLLRLVDKTTSFVSY
ncbi:polyadenylation factor subunit 2-like, partial [Agrilus planipennis]|uniref:Polyadenylation factor subunit 2-like n=1 Tax=Agrilus planipennis TaxID=224129 RepID=A0A1W4XFQ8_AGRPL